MRSFIAILSLSTLIACNPDEATNPDPLDPPETVDETPSARFADASDEERLYAVQAAIGMSSVYAMFTVFQAEFDALETYNDGTPETACPGAEIVGRDPVVIAYEADGCTAPSGLAYRGTAEVTNVTFLGGILGGEEYAMSETGPMAMEFDAFSVEGGADGTVILDGSFYQSERAPGEVTTAEMELSIAGEAGTLDVALYIESTDGLAEVLDGSEATISDMGRFTIAGRYSLFDDIGELVLTGADEMRISMTPDAAGCLPVTIDGAPSAPLCAEEADSN